jgi:hypothetical protein
MSKQVVTKLVVNTRKRNKATTFFRPILIFPILIFVSTFHPTIQVHREYFVPTCSTSAFSFGF